MAPNLGSVAAGAHLAPAAAVVLRRVKEEPAARLTRALAQRLDARREEQVCRRVRNLPEHAVERMLRAAPAPRKAYAGDMYKCKMCQPAGKLGIKDRNIGGCRRHAVEQPREDPIEGFAQHYRPRQDGIRLLRASVAGL